MNLKYEALPDQRTTLPKYKYHLPPPRSSHYNHQDSYSGQAHRRSAHKQNHSGSKDTYNDFSIFDDNTHESIAKDLIEENMLLREEVLQSRQLIKELEMEVQCCRRQLNDKRRNDRERQSRMCARQFKQEILLLLEKNKAIEEEILILKSALNYRQIQTANLNRMRSTSLDCKRRSQPQPKQYENTESHSKSEELISSIKGMYFKIMGFKAQSLRQLWRWLKQMGYTFSNLRKWSQKAKSKVDPPQLSSQVLSELLQEVLQILR